MTNDPEPEAKPAPAHSHHGRPSSDRKRRRLSLLARFTIVQALATVILAVITFEYVRLTHGMLRVQQDLLKAQIEPYVDMQVRTPKGGGTEVVIRNAGVHSVVDLAVDVFLGLRINWPDGGGVVVHARAVGQAGEPSWWTIGRLEPGKSVSRSLDEQLLSDRTKERVARSTEFLGRKGQPPDSSPSKAPSERPSNKLAVVQLVYHREFDRRKYTQNKEVWVVTKSGRAGLEERDDSPPELEKLVR